MGLFKKTPETPEQRAERERLDKLRAEVRAASAGHVPNTDSRLVCPHCGKQGTVTTRAVKLKKGVSGAKATGAVLTAGVSVVATGLSRKETASERTCSHCRSTWHVS